jgi:hypothetical protein
MLLTSSDSTVVVPGTTCVSVVVNQAWVGTRRTVLGPVGRQVTSR